MAEVGVGRVTHRMVAARAGVPLGATTYYFPTLADLIAAGLALVSGDVTAELESWQAAITRAVIDNSVIGNPVIENPANGNAVSELPAGRNPPDADAAEDRAARLAAALAGKVVAYAGDQPKALLEYELYLAAARTPALRPLARAWLDGLHAMLAPVVGDSAARSISALLDGVMLQAVVTGDPVDGAALAAAVRHLILPAAP